MSILANEQSREHSLRDCDSDRSHMMIKKEAVFVKENKSQTLMKDQDSQQLQFVSF